MHLVKADAELLIKEAEYMNIVTLSKDRNTIFMDDRGLYESLPYDVIVKRLILDDKFQHHMLAKIYRGTLKSEPVFCSTETIKGMFLELQKDLFGVEERSRYHREFEGYVPQDTEIVALVEAERKKTYRHPYEPDTTRDVSTKEILGVLGKENGYGRKAHSESRYDGRGAYAGKRAGYVPKGLSQNALKPRANVGRRQAAV